MRQWITFRLHGKLLCACTLNGTFVDEPEEIVGLLAYEHNCKEEDIVVAIETGTPK